MGRELQMVTSEFPPDLIDRLIFAIESRINQTYIVERPLTKERIAKHLNVTVRTISRLSASGQLEPHYFDGCSIPFYFPSQANERLNGSKVIRKK